MAKIIIIEDEKSIRAALRDILEYEGYEVDEAENGLEGIEMLVTDYYDVALCNLNMPKMNGFDVLFHAYEAGISTQIIVITAVGTVENAVESTRLGAFDFIAKPPDINRLLKTTRDAVERYKLVEANRLLRKKIYRIGEFVGKSSSVQTIKEYINRTAQLNVSVLISGPSGVGKTMVAHQIHYQAVRSLRPLVTVNCASIPDELLDSELFGYERGAFAGAATRRIGKLEQAEGGTLILDEIGRMNLPSQEKLKCAIQQQAFTRIGGTKKVGLNTRFLSTTTKDLHHAVAEGDFMEGLYNLIGKITIAIPPLGDRKDDIPLLIEAFLQAISGEYSMPVKEIDPAALAYLMSLPWKANSRELRNVVERLMIMSEQVITLEEVQLYA